MTGLVPVLLLVAVMFGGGVYVLLARPPHSWRSGLLLVVGSAVVAMAGVSRLAASTRDALDGQQFAVVLAIAGAIIGALLSRSGREVAP